MLLHQEAPAYPRLAQRAGEEGWVLLGFSIETDGTVHDIVVLDSSDRYNRFSPAAKRALAKWVFEPPMVEGKPQKLSNQRQLISFALGGVKAPTEEFVRRYNDVIALIQAQDFSAARQALSELHESQKANLYEVNKLHVLDAYYHEAAGDFESARFALARAVSGGRSFFPEQEYRALIRAYLERLIDAGHFASALSVFETVNEYERVRRDDPLRETISNIKALENSSQPFAVDATIPLECNCDEPLYYYRPLRREFGVLDVSGRIDRMTLTCDSAYTTLDYEPGLSWSTPTQYGDCSLIIYGEPGTTFKIVEY